MQHNKLIEGLRGYLILNILLYHYTYRYHYYSQTLSSIGEGWVAGKSIGVIGFLLISGFLLFKSVQRMNVTSNKGMIEYLMRKIKRLYIPFFVAIVFLLICSRFIPFLNNPSIEDSLTNLFLIPTVLKCPLIDGAHWYFFALIQLTLIIPTAIYAYKSKNWLLLGSIVLIFAYLLATHTFKLNKLFLLSFIAGSTLAIIDNKRIKYLLYAIISMVITVVTGYYILLLLFSLFPFIVYQKLPPKVSLFFNNKPAILLGTFSYMWYLIHQQLGYSIMYQLNLAGICDWGSVISAMLITLIVAIGLQKIADKLSSYL